MYDTGTGKVGETQAIKPAATPGLKEFTDNIEFAKEVDDKCRNNPGELREAPNCINAREAVAKDRLIGSGDDNSFKAPRID